MTKFSEVLLAAALLFWVTTALFSRAASAASGTGTPGKRRRGIPRDRLETNGDQLDDTTRTFAAAPPKTTLHVFERESGANAHCQLDNPPLSAAVLFDWLDERLR